MALVFAINAPVMAASENTVKASIVKHSIEMGVDPAITLSIAKSESGFKHETRSPQGAVGVFQLMPSTARRMGLNPYSLDDNIKGGIMYYKSMYKMFGSMQLAIAAYNAGPGNVKKYKTIPPFRETKRYVNRIMADYYQYKAHTDPAVTAYYAQKNKVTVNPQSNSNIKEHSSAKPVVKSEDKKAIETPIANISTQVVASSPDQHLKTAPMPSFKFDQSKRKLNTDMIKSLPIEGELKKQSVSI